MSTRVWQSTIIDSPLSKVWSVIRPLDFVYSPRVTTVDLEGKETREDTVGGIRIVWYTDKTQQRIRLLELSDQRNEISWEVISSEPAISVLSQIHTVRLRRVTETNKTFVEWTTDFSKDASTEVTEDAKYKQKENFAALAVECAKKYTFKTTAEEALKGHDVKGKVVFITGANSGLGLETARVFAKAGAHVFGACRDMKKAEPLFEKIRKDNPNAKIEGISLDLNSLKSVRNCAAAFKAKNLPLHILICNAGIMALKDRTLTEDKLEAQFSVNHVAHHLLVTLLLDVVKKSAPARIVVLSSTGHKYAPVDFDDIMSEKKYEKFRAYSQSKAANALFAKHLNTLMVKEKVNVEAFSLCPGGIRTGLVQHLDAKDVEFVSSFHIRYKTVEQGAATTIVAATNPDLAGKGGSYLSDCNIEKAAPHASDDAIAAKLWDVTEAIIAKQSKV